MSATLKTPNYNLPVFAEEDFTDWSDYNRAMEIIDSSMQENKEKIETVEEAEQTGAAAIQQLQQSIVSMGDTIQNQTQNLNSLTTRVENNESHDNDRDLAITAIQNEVSSYDGRIRAINDSVNYLKQDVTDVESMNNLQEQKINLNTTKIQQNTSDIETNTTDIQQNTSDIQKNTKSIQKNAADIQANSNRIDDTNDRINNIQLSVNYPIKETLDADNIFIEIPENIGLQTLPSSNTPKLFFAEQTYTEMGYSTNIYRNMRKIVMAAFANSFTVESYDYGIIEIPIKSNSFTFYYGFAIYEDKSHANINVVSLAGIEEDERNGKKLLRFYIPNSSRYVTQCMFTIVIYFYNGD